MTTYRLINAALAAGALLWGASADATCTATPGLDESYAMGWGIDHRNTRYQPNSNLNASNAGRLRLKWVYGLAAQTPRSYPLVTEDTIFVGDGGRGLIALERETGCERWVLPHEGQIASAIVRAQIDDRAALVFIDRSDGVWLVDAATGEPIWHAQVNDEPVPTYSGTPLVTNDTVFVPVASLEVGLAVNPFYGCCTTSGGMAAFDLQTGVKRWYLPTIAEEAQVTGSHFFGFVQKHGPSGAPVWAAPAFDAANDRLFYGTGQNYSHPTTGTSDAIFAVSATTGAIEWVRQFTPDDAYTAACNVASLNHPNCPDPLGPDVDFGAPPMLVNAPDGRQLLIAGQKSSDVHAMEPASGERVWTTNLGRGGIIGGVHWGLAVNESLGLVFAPISDKEIAGFPAPGVPRPGLYALDVLNGAVRWHYERPARCPDTECVYGLSAAVIAANDIVVAGSMDGFLEIFAAQTGERLWHFDAWREFDAVNGVETHGGAFDGHGPMLADDLVIVTAGYQYVGQQRGGNALLVFEIVDDE